jgi:hypothetical protein
MRQRRWLWSLIAMVAAGWAGDQAQAQFRGIGRPPANPFGRPAISPYLNLNRGGVPAINYFNLVRPQQDAFAAIQGLEYGQEQLQQFQYGAQSPFVGTGHATSFFNYSHYYPRLTGSIGNSGSGGYSGYSGPGGFPTLGQPGVGRGSPSISLITLPQSNNN